MFLRMMKMDITLKKFLNPLEKAKEEWELYIVFKGNEWQEIKDEIKYPSTELDCQIAVVHRVVLNKHMSS
ncbi:hypothetical protein [Cytobacillus kochii]|uniref:hypothetical protein n=1 Tax=Cytobacillus kochii TaxID=859143 RepID=UPI0025A20407|nr:hypothetical protein [Cytobacillus kochii]MDM5205339.1 hypothetical protein [Cytobacillus kochii]